MNKLAKEIKALYFDENGKAHDAFVLSEPKGAKNTVKLIYHPKEARRFWRMGSTEKEQKKWIEIKDVVEKQFAEKIIHIEKDNDGVPIENIIGIKNCYKIVNG